MSEDDSAVADFIDGLQYHRPGHLTLNVLRAAVVLAEQNLLRGPVTAHRAQGRLTKALDALCGGPLWDEVLGRGEESAGE